MIKEKYLARDWAETIRLYSGFLEETQRLLFIKELAEAEILLACECRSTSFADDKGLDEYLASVALETAQDVSKASKSAKGLLALAELDRFREIADFFRSAKTPGKQQDYFQVIFIYIRNGNEDHIFELLRILAASNLGLFNKAMDFILDLSLESFTNSIRGKRLLDIIGLSESLIRDKIICLFEIKSELNSGKSIFYNLLNHQQIKYAEKLSKLLTVTVDAEILEIFNNYVQRKENTVTLKLFLGILENVLGDFDRTQLNLMLSQSLNPMVKNIALDFPKGTTISKELALKMCHKNLKIGNRSSVEFVLKLRQDLELGQSIPLEDVVESLLKDVKFQRIEMAYNLVRTHYLNLDLSPDYFYRLLTGYLSYENLSLARHIVLTEFPRAERYNALHRLCCLALNNSYLSKLGKQILLEDLQEHQGTFEINREYIGIVLGIYNGKLQILFSLNHGTIDVPKEMFRSKINSIIVFRFTSIEEKLEISNINPISSTPIPKYIQKYWFRDHYLGQIINFRPTSIRKNRAVMKKMGDNLSFFLMIGEITDGYVDDIHKFISLDEEYRAYILRFDYLKKIIFCSLKSLKKRVIKEEKIEEISFEDKIGQLMKKYNK